MSLEPTPAVQPDREAAPRMGLLARLLLGIALPVVLFLASQIALLISAERSGSYDGLGVLLAAVVMTPVLALANIWVLFPRWQWKRSVALAGCILPGMVAVVLCLWIHGQATRRAINAAIVAPFTAIWLFVALLFLPLAIVVIRRLRDATRRRA